MTEQRAAMEALQGWLRTRPALVTMCTGGIHPNAVPSGTRAPYIVLSLATASDTYAQENIRVDTEMQFIVRGVCEGNGPLADQMDAEIDAALSNANGGTVVTEQNGYRIWAIRERPLNTFSTTGAVTYRYAGGWYRVNARRLI